MHVPHNNNNSYFALGGGRGGTMLVESKYGEDFRKDSDTECVNSMAVSGDY